MLVPDVLMLPTLRTRKYTSVVFRCLLQPFLSGWGPLALGDTTPHFGFLSGFSMPQPLGLTGPTTRQWFWPILSITIPQRFCLIDTRSRTFLVTTLAEFIYRSFPSHTSIHIGRRPIMSLGSTGPCGIRLERSIGVGHGWPCRSVDLPLLVP